MIGLTKLINLVRGKSKTANVAKERLQIIISHERVARSTNNLDLPTLKQELLAVIAKYIKIDEQQISVQLEREDNCSVLELNITLPNNN
jgi:cell division topological specificity factor